MKKDDILPKSLPEWIQTLVALGALVAGIRLVIVGLWAHTTGTAPVSLRLLSLSGAGILFLLSFLSFSLFRLRRRIRDLESELAGYRRIPDPKVQAEALKILVEAGAFPDLMVRPPIHSVQATGEDARA